MLLQTRLLLGLMVGVLIVGVVLRIHQQKPVTIDDGQPTTAIPPVAEHAAEDGPSSIQSFMFNESDTLTITKITYRSESTGSIDPSSIAYRQFWEYAPSAEESASLLREIKNSEGQPLRDFLVAHQGPLTTYTRTHNNSDGAVGGSNRSWKIVITNGAETVTVYDTTHEFQTTGFPYALVQEKGIHRGEPKDSPLATPDIGVGW